MTPRRPDRAPGVVGEQAEHYAERYLSKRGCALVCRNYRCRAGELDLVMRDGATLVFVEVRYRRSAGFGGPAESVDANKRRRLRTAAEHFLQRYRGAAFESCRFDVVALIGDITQPQVEWIADAFE
ncbi:MAG: YraN family protein [Gammaproteobacteria bacterium]